MWRERGPGDGVPGNLEVVFRESTPTAGLFRAEESFYAEKEAGRGGDVPRNPPEFRAPGTLASSATT